MVTKDKVSDARNFNQIGDHLKKHEKKEKQHERHWTDLVSAGCRSYGSGRRELVQENIQQGGQEDRRKQNQVVVVLKLCETDESAEQNGHVHEVDHPVLDVSAEFS